jgi:hypothetical protein
MRDAVNLRRVDVQESRFRGKVRRHPGPSPQQIDGRSFPQLVRHTSTRLGCPWKFKVTEVNEWV